MSGSLLELTAAGGEPVRLDGRGLRLEEIAAVARYRARVELGSGARARVERSRSVVDRLIEARAKVYGLTTGFGSKRDIVIDHEQLAQLQINLIRSHACGVGPALSEDVVRATMLLRANTLARGNSGVRPEVIEALIGFLNRDVYPWIPSRGSLGASGDLAPLSHLALALCNDPHARFYRHEPGAPAPSCPPWAGRPPADYVETPVDWRFQAAPDGVFDDDLPPLVLEAKEGLALNNGTQMTVALGALAVFDAIALLESAELVCGLSVEAVKGNRDAFDTRLHEARPLLGQGQVAANIRAFTADSQNLDLPVNTARLHRVRWALYDLQEILAAEADPDRDRLERVRRLETMIRDFEAGVVRTLEEGLEATSAEDRKTLPSRAIVQRIFRTALEPVRAEVLALYSELLTSTLHGEEVKGRDLIAEAVAELQLALPETPSVQDDYSFRCTPQVLGAVRKVIHDVRDTLLIEANSATDNPLIFPPRPDEHPGDEPAYRAGLTIRECIEAVVSGGNFHGEPMALALDQLGIALAELANISERRTAHLVDGSLSNGLPSLLVWHSGLNSGLMIPQYVAASLVSENKVLAHPASVDSIPTCENTEDHVSMSALAALKCRQILENAQRVVAIELLTAYQGVYFRKPLTCGVATQRLWDAMSDGGMTPIRSDRVLYPDIEWSLRFLKGGGVWEIARDAGTAVVD